MPGESKVTMQMKKFLDQHGWHYLVSEDQTLRGLVTGDSGQWHWMARCPAERRFLLFCAYCPVNVPQDRLGAAAQYLMRANWGLQFGNFELDWTEGRVSFRTSIAVNPSGVSANALEQLVFGNCSTMDRYLAGLLAVAVGGVNPEQAVRKAECDPHGAAGNSAAINPENPAAAHAEPDGPAPGPGGAEDGGRLRRFFPSDN